MPQQGSSNPQTHGTFPGVRLAVQMCPTPPMLGSTEAARDVSENGDCRTRFKLFHAYGPFVAASTHTSGCPVGASSQTYRLVQL